MKSFAYFAAAAACEIAGCYSVWMWLRLRRGAWWLAPGVFLLLAFAALLTRVESALAGRAYAAYGGVYIAASLLWMATVERTRPTASDLLGAGLCLAGAGFILLGRGRLGP